MQRFVDSLAQTCNSALQIIQVYAQAAAASLIQNGEISQSLRQLDLAERQAFPQRFEPRSRPRSSLRQRRTLLGRELLSHFEQLQARTSLKS